MDIIKSLNELSKDNNNIGYSVSFIYEMNDTKPLYDKKKYIYGVKKNNEIKKYTSISRIRYDTAFSYRFIRNLLETNKEIDGIHIYHLK